MGTCSFDPCRASPRSEKTSFRMCLNESQAAFEELLAHEMGIGMVPVADPAGHTGDKLIVDW